MWSRFTRRRRSTQNNSLRFVAHFEVLENRSLLAAAIPGITLDPVLVPKFENEVPNPLDSSFIFQPTKPGGNKYEIGIYQTSQDLGLTNEEGDPLMTTVWGYGTSPDDVTYPGRTIVAQQNKPISVQWTNNLVDDAGEPLPHLFPVDSTLHWADPLQDGQYGPNPYIGPVPVVTHLHGGHTRSDSDGLPDAWFTPGYEYTGRLFNKVYKYDNDQEAATLWYHDHALGVTRLNVYAGLAGFYILRDKFDTGLPDDPKTKKNENPSNLPVGPYEIPLVIQDRMFKEDGQLFYPSEPEEEEEEEGQPNSSVLPEFFGDTILINGKAWPKLDVEPRAYRLRLLNGSDSRFYNLFFEGAGPTIYQIGTDGGLLPAPVALDQLLLAPGERADVIIDFAGRMGDTFTLRNNAPGPFKGSLMEGELVYPDTTSELMVFNVVEALNTSIPDNGVPSTLVPPIEPLTQTGPTRGLMLFEGTDGYGRLQPLLGIVNPNSPSDGTLQWNDAITENPKLNSVEVWEIYNATEDAHPIHLHLVQFQVINRQEFTADVVDKPMHDGGGPFTAMGGKLTNIEFTGEPMLPADNEDGWKDTVIMNPGEVTRIIAKFDRRGEYVWHCHILSHEDHEMMRPYFVGVSPPGQSMAHVPARSHSIIDVGLLLQSATGKTTPAMAAMTAAFVSPMTSHADVAGRNRQPNLVREVAAAAQLGPTLIDRENAKSLFAEALAVARTEQYAAQFDELLAGSWFGARRSGSSHQDAMDRLFSPVVKNLRQRPSQAIGPA